MWRTILSLAMSAALAASFAPHSQAAAPLSVHLSNMMFVAPGQVRMDISIAGFLPNLHPTIEGALTIGERSIGGLPFPAVASRIPGVIDLPAGKARIGEVAVGDFTPVPPLDENMPIAAEVTVRQGDQVAADRQAGVLLLPTVIVPGYLNDFGGSKPDSTIMSALERRGYRDDGGWPSVFWFAYQSQSLGVKEAARALATYVRSVVLPRSYAARINVVAYSLGGLLARWNMATEPGWDRLVNKFAMVGVPNEGTVMSYVDGWYPAAGIARTPAARSMIPTFPFWRPAANAWWGFPSDGRNVFLAELNTHPLPEAIRAYAFYGNRPFNAEGRGTWRGITGQLPNAAFTNGPGDGVVLVDSALGMPINGGSDVSGLADRLVMTVDLGPVDHRALLGAASGKIADLLTSGKAAVRSPLPARGVDGAHTVRPAGRGLGLRRDSPQVGLYLR
jgi:hypothetical protein